MRHHGGMGELITTAEAAQLAQRSRSQINRDATSGKLEVAQQYPGYRGARMFDADVIRATYPAEPAEAHS
jgi:hypothetical protein